MVALAEKECVPCKGGVTALKGDDLARLRRELKPGWQVVKEHHLEREFKFKDFREALNFTNEVGELAEAQSHHPDIYLGWGKVKVTIWTHKIDGLTESDFVLAAKIDTLEKEDPERQRRTQRYNGLNAEDRGGPQSGDSSLRSPRLRVKSLRGLSKLLCIATEQELKRQAAAVTRKFALLRAHGLIKKVSGTHRTS